MGVAKPPPGLRGDVAEIALAVVEKQVRRLRVTDVAANVADRLVDVAVHRDQIEAAVQVDIEERASEAEAVARSLPDARAAWRHRHTTPRPTGR